MTTEEKMKAVQQSPQAKRFSPETERLVNFIWEQYEIHRIITKKVYNKMIENARKSDK